MIIEAQTAHKFEFQQKTLSTTTNPNTPTMTPVNAQDMIPKGSRRGGRRHPPKEENDDETLIVAFGSYENVLQVRQDKIAQALKKVDQASPQRTRRVLTRENSSDSFEDYHKAVYASH